MPEDWTHEGEDFTPVTIVRPDLVHIDPEQADEVGAGVVQAIKDKKSLSQIFNMLSKIAGKAITGLTGL